MEEILRNSVMLLISSQLCSEWHHMGSLKSATVGVFTPQKLDTTTNQGLIYCFVNGLLQESKWEKLTVQINLKSVLCLQSSHCA